MNITRVALFSLSTLSAFALQAATTLTWNGASGNGLWGTPGNWTPAQAPAAGDTLVFENASALTVENNIEGLSVKSLQFKGSAAVTVNGLEISLGVKNTVDGITNIVPLTINAPLRVSASESKWWFAEPTTVNGDVTIDANCILNLNGKPSNATKPNNHFYGTVSGGGTLKNAARFAYTRFHKPVSVGSITFGIGGGFYLEDDCIVTTADKKAEIAYGAYFLCKVNAFAPTTVWTWKKDGYRDANNSTNSRFCFQPMGEKQTIDRIESDPPLYSGAWKNSDFIEADASLSPVLTLLCTQDAVTYGCVCNGVGLTLDSATGHSQTFMDRDHTMTGPIVVKGGTFVSAGTNSFASVSKILLDGGNFTVTSSTPGSLRGVTDLCVFNGSTLTVGADATGAFAANQVSLAVVGTGKLVIPDDMDLTLGDLHVNGLRPGAATVFSGVAGTGVDKVVSWIQGAGKIRYAVPATTENEWTGAVSDDWNVAGNWATGVPSSSLAAFVYGGCAVMKDAAIEPFKKLTLTERYGVPAELVIRGTHAFTDFTADVTDAKVTVASGADLSFTSTVSAAQFVVGAGGEVKAEAGSKILVKTPNLFRLTDDGSCDLAGETLLASDSINFRTAQNGRVRVSGNGKFGIDPDAAARASTGTKRLQMASATATGTNFLEIAGNATVGQPATGVNFSTFVLQYGASGTTVMEIDTTGTVHLGGSVYIGYCGNNHTGLTHGEMRVKNGLVKNSYTGIYLGYYWKGYESLTGGRLVQSGGCIDVYGADYTQDCGSGFIVGCGTGLNKSDASEQTKFVSGPGFYGIYEQSGGAFTNGYQTTMLGIGAATGTVIKTGGIFAQNSRPASNSGKVKENLSLILGLRGGLGVWNQSGGTTVCAADAWVGGAPEDARVGAFSYLDAATPARSGRGEMTLSGGTFSVGGTLGVAYDGPGSLTMAGDGQLTVKDLNLYVSTDRIDSSKQHPANLAFTVTDGAAPSVNVTGTMTIASGAKLTVDASQYTGEEKIWLLRANAISGGFADADVTFTASDRRYVLKRTDKGLCLKMDKGLVLIVR